MKEKSKVRYIPPLPLKRETRVAIYARVSTNSADQLGINIGTDDFAFQIIILRREGC